MSTRMEFWDAPDGTPCPECETDEHVNGHRIHRRDCSLQFKQVVPALSAGSVDDALNRANLEQAEELESLRVVVQQAANWFEEYAAIHDRKGDEEKKRRNQSRADYLRNALRGIPAFETENTDDVGLTAVEGAWARSMALEIVQSLADSEPTPRASGGQELLVGTEFDGMFVVESDELVRLIDEKLSDALFDKHIALRGAAVAAAGDQ